MTHSALGTARRADARHNVARILRAAVTCLGRDPAASMNDIAREAGVGRVTVYAHYPSREALVEAAMVHVLAEGDEVLATVDLTGDPRDGLRALIEAGWMLLAQSTSVLEAALAALPPGRVQDLHAGPEQRIHDLVRRGQALGVFRTDLPARWLASVLHHLLHGAVADVAAGRLDPADAPRYLSAVTLAAYGATGA
ncbi:TetR/AcrR family transcriptional regulator [Virgisporangium ochraceum]|uniref:TetR family transcriptional regulator n=1 Tax=Virgisporangium ochraceum TaxID=65505 RepID=A0A8J4A398_9ACTN|nr:TetR/AcrR family transcriptional regulator [Virgisporangium ochraceum]GIJ75047.1 TetR family transcriptional regulator [Virgisporangium ochraceum]